MSGHAYARHAAPSPSAQFRESTDFLRWELAPDERIGSPVRTRRRWARWAVAGSLASAAAGGWLVLDDKPAAIAWTTSQAASALAVAKTLVAELMREAPVAETSPAVPSPQRLADPAPSHAAVVDALPPREVAPADVAAVGEPAPEATQDAAPSSGSDGAAQDAKPAPLPPLPPLTDPLQRKAEAVGLHPELSRALLESLSEADFKNAGLAVKKAIAETPEDGVLIWPAKPAAGVARFRIHFVPGVSPACRRYVVGVAKSGWLTTALPMERCGAKRKLAGTETPLRHPSAASQGP